MVCENKLILNTWMHNEMIEQHNNNVSMADGGKQMVNKNQLNTISYDVNAKYIQYDEHFK